MPDLVWYSGRDHSPDDGYHRRTRCRLQTKNAILGGGTTSGWAFLFFRKIQAAWARVRVSGPTCLRDQWGFVRSGNAHMLSDHLTQPPLANCCRGVDLGAVRRSAPQRCVENARQTGRGGFWVSEREVSDHLEHSRSTAPFNPELQPRCGGARLVQVGGQNQRFRFFYREKRSFLWRGHWEALGLFKHPRARRRRQTLRNRPCTRAGLSIPFSGGTKAFTGNVRKKDDVSVCSQTPPTEEVRRGPSKDAGVSRVAGPEQRVLSRIRWGRARGPMRLRPQDDSDYVGAISPTRKHAGRSQFGFVGGDFFSLG